MGFTGELAVLADGVAFLPSFANVIAFETPGGLVLVDTGGFLLGDHVHAQLRAWTDQPLHTAIFTHGHVDHVFGVPPFEAEAAEHGWPAPRVVAHENVPRRFARYRLTRGYNGVINARQFGLGELEFPSEFRPPDEIYSDEVTIEVGRERFELHHAKGETDDHTWVWAPERKILCCGDLFIWATPNAGNPQKAQRHARDWAQALRRMATLEADMMLPGHGPPVMGAARVRTALADAAALLESLVEQTLALMNEGASLDRVVQSVRAPEELMAKPYLRPIYDEPEFIVRNLWRLYGGWYDGDPSHLKPAPAAALAAELAELAGGAGRLAARARELATEGDLKLAGHLAELAVQADPSLEDAHRARAEVNERRAATEASTMARGLFSWAASQSRSALGEGGE